MTILWRRLDFPGHEWCRLAERRSGKSLEGVALFSFRSDFCRLTYCIECDSKWQTKSAAIEGTIEKKDINLLIESDLNGHWTIDGKQNADIDGCIDIDLGFSPSTNLLPIRRLDLRTGQTERVVAAWVEFPSLKLRTLDQTYKKKSDRLYHYESAGGKFQRDLQVIKKGFVVRYPGFWEVETG
jgi:uncharacterized protein